MYHRTTDWFIKWRSNTPVTEYKDLQTICVCAIGNAKIAFIFTLRPHSTNQTHEQQWYDSKLSSMFYISVLLWMFFFITFHFPSVLHGMKASSNNFGCIWTVLESNSICDREQTVVNHCGCLQTWAVPSATYAREKKRERKREERERKIHSTTVKSWRQLATRKK